MFAIFGGQAGPTRRSDGSFSTGYLNEIWMYNACELGFVS
jgi:hypothetical protein